MGNRICLYDGTALTEIGSCGVEDVEGRWVQQVTRYSCGEGHMIFVTGKGKAKEVLDLELEAAEGALSHGDENKEGGAE